MPEITLLPRKRRRPALSCVECRRRKIKCDRTMPCSHCLQLKSTICTFPETHTPVGNRRNARRVSPIPLPISNDKRSPRIRELELTSKVASGPLSESSSAFQLTAEGSHSGRGSWGSSPISTPEINSVDTNFLTLVNRAGNIEKDNTLSESHDKSSDENMSVLGINMSTHGDVMLQVGGNHLKDSDIICQTTSERTQFFGRSHWM